MSASTPWRLRRIGLVAILGAVALNGGQRRAAASGLQVPEPSAEALGKAGAGLASAAGAEAAWMNPAALTGAETIGVAATTAFAEARSSFAAAGGARTRAAPSRALVPALFAAVPIPTRLGRLAAGLAVTVPHAWRVSWPADWPGAERAIEMDISVLAISPSLAARLGDRVSVAIGTSLLRGALAYEAAFGASADGRLAIDGAGFSASASASLLVDARPGVLRVGAVARSRNLSQLRLTGRAHLPPADAALLGSPAVQSIVSSLALPDLFGLGVAYRPHARVAVEAELGAAFWKRLERIDFDFELRRFDTLILLEGRTALTGRLGATFELPTLAAALRAGLLLEQSALRGRSLHPAIPDGARLGLSFGAGVNRGRARVDVAYQQLRAGPRRSAPSALGPTGSYETVAHVVALTIGRR